MKFVKGMSGNPAGKPKGARDKKWQSLQTLWDELMEPSVWGKLDAEKKADILFCMVKLHFDRAMTNMPKDFNESRGNAEKAYKEMKEALSVSDSGRNQNVSH